ncbi:unnamed protein product [Blepharisma stoltei]|uniref:Tr-type G domain-containing protein n=1 Tax=Blepharisma stoltei TaxID=1481888 RepID=A0AAU9I9U9_9CILI|nr:unnamed protein product [Blepharisma stoltei]
MDEDLYDEFGNPINAGSESGEPEESPPQDEEVENNEEGQGIIASDNIMIEPTGQEIVLHEDKRYYLDLDQVYPEAEALIMEEDAQPITQPIIQPVIQKNFEFTFKEVPFTTSPIEFLVSLSHCPDSIRNIAFIGHLHHGKTTFIDLLVEDTHPQIVSDPNDPLKYMDTRNDERKREISIKAKPLTVVLETSREKSYLFNIIDTPGHPNFSDEVTAGLRLADGVILIVDVIEGVMINTKQLLIHALENELKVIVVINKFDRLPLELKIPPGDVYFKVKHTLDEINSIISAHAPWHPKVSPINENVIFASGLYGMAFTLSSMAKVYTNIYGPNFDSEEFAKRLWGDLYYNKETRSFARKPPIGKSNSDRSFIEFIVEPIYKLLGYAVSEEKEQLEKFLSSVGLFMKKKHYTYDSKTLLKIVLRTFFKKPSCLVDLAVKNFPAPSKSKKFEQNYKGPLAGEIIEEIIKGKDTGPLVVDIVKQYHDSECKFFYIFGRVLSGTLRPGELVNVLGQKYSIQNPEDKFQAEIDKIYYFNSRYKLQVQEIPAGCWALIESSQIDIPKTCTITSPDLSENIEILKPYRFSTSSIVKIAMEPYNPSDLPKMLQGLNFCSKSYPLLDFKVQETGEHVIAGTGELYLDSVLHDVRELYTDIEIKLSDPYVSFNETVIDSSSFKCFAETPNGKNRFSMIAEPLEAVIGSAIEKHKIHINWPPEKLSSHFEENYNWDVLASSSIWAFGPDSYGSNILINDILPYERDDDLLASIKNPVVQGFQWACREGPLCEEPIRLTKFKILEAAMAAEPIYRASGQIIPTVRRVCYSSFLLSSPRLMEPYYLVEIQCTQDCIPAVHLVMTKRRGHIDMEEPKPGSPHYTLLGTLPVIDSFGFETDLRTYTSGMAFCVSIFDHWEVVISDPLDRNIKIKPLEPCPVPHLAREFMLKTRRRKGLTDDITITKFFDHPLLRDMAKEDQDLAPYF